MVAERLRHRLARHFGGIAAGLAFGVIAVWTAPAASASVSPSSSPPPSPSSATLPQGPWTITFGDIARAESQSWLDVDQVRRVLERGRAAADPSRWIEAREHLQLGPDLPDGTPRFRLDLLGIRDANGSLPGEQVALRRSLFDAHSGFLHMHSSLSIHDADAAAANYFLVYLDDGVRAGRPTHRFAILPRHFGANPWLVELDVATRYPLYRGEFDSAGRLVSELVVERFGVLDPALRNQVDWWSPSLQTFEFPDLAAALQYLPPAAFSLPTAADLPFGYGLDSIRVVMDDLSPVTSLVLGYTDGIDEMFVVASLNATPPPLPQPVAGTRPVYALFEYRDQNVGQWMFHHNDVRHLIVGRSGQAWTAVLAHELLARAVQGS